MEQLVRLGDVCTVVSGSTPKTSVDEYWNGDVKWITPAELDADSYYIHDSVKHITELGRTKTGLSYMPVGTVILSSRAPIGKTAILGCEMCCNQGFKNLICTDRIFNEYLYHFLRAKTNYLNSLGRGATFKELSKGIVENVLIPLPAIEEQHHIADLFASVEELIQTKKQQLDLLDELVKSRFIELFGDPNTNPMKWKKEQLQINATLLNGRAYKQDELLDDGKYPVLRVGNFFSNRGWYYSDLELDEDKYCDDGDLLYAWSASFGPRIWNGGKVIYHYHIWKVLVGEKYNKQFLCHLLDYATASFMGDTHGIGMMHLTKSGMEETEFIVPPIDLQNQFAAFVEQTDKSKLAIQESLAELETLKKALMQKYFG